MAGCYINGIGNVGIQAFDFNIMFDTPTPLQPFNPASHPSYKDIIASAILRRLSSGVKMGIYASQQALNEAAMTSPTAVIVGTGLGCIQDSEKFLNAILDNNEEFLTPTSFIQSTHNTVAAQVALQLGCKGYNMSYVNGGNSFESALLDSIIQLTMFSAESVLVGGVDETSSGFNKLFELAGVKKANGSEISFKNPSSSGIPLSEGANFFIVSKQKSDSSYAELVDVKIFNKIYQPVPVLINDFLNRHQLSSNDIDVVLLGYNADINQQNFFKPFSDLFSQTAQAYYQHISGSYDTASAYGLKLASEILKTQQYPQLIQWNAVKPQQLKTILLINQSHGTDYSFVLVRSC